MTAPTNGQTQFLLASMRAASSNLRTWQLEVEAIGIALKNGLITSEVAVGWLDQLGLLEALPDTKSQAESAMAIAEKRAAP